MAKFFFTTIFWSLLLHCVTFSSLTVGAVDDDHKLFPNQKLVVGQTLISQNQVFEMGFFTPGKSSNRFLGIWYKSTPDVVVWVANRNNPITASQEPLFLISSNGSLVISSGKSSIILSQNHPSVVPSNPVLHLLDSGNLVVVNETMDDDYLWQSFDYPTDTLLPGMKMVDDADAGVERYPTSWKSPDDPSPGDFILKIQNHGLPQLVAINGTTKRYRNGQWNGMNFCGLHFANYAYKPELNFRKGRLISIGEPYDDSSLLVRATLDTSGLIQRHFMNAGSDKWKSSTTFPLDMCDEYDSCGPNCICRPDMQPIRCQCFTGFEPKIQKDWDLLDWSGGCTRTKPLNCHGGDGFVEVRGVKYPDMSTFWLNTTMSLGECRAECLKNCNCTAYANPFIKDGGSGCLMWSGDLLDTKQLSAADSKQNMYIRVPLSETGKSFHNFLPVTPIHIHWLVNLPVELSTDLEEEEKENERPIKLILISIAFGVITSAIINKGLLFMATHKRQVKRYNEDVELPVIKMAIIVQATNDFSTDNMIGVGGFGLVYKGSMPSGEEIAVKRLSRSSQQGVEEFRNEVMLIAKLQHRNLVRLLGCCIEKEERMLIYEYLQNKSLDYFVFDHSRRTVLTWPMRYDIITGIARGLLYLHHDSRLKIIHRDLKTSNILLDANMTPKISDFGLARTFEEDQSLARTKRVIGTYGYMAPEYAIDGKFSVKSDIFSFGVILLEIISGKKNRGYGDSDHHLNLLGHAWLLWKENKIVELMDECLNDTFVEFQVKRCMQVGLLCVQKFADDRPIMSSVVSMVTSDGAVLPEPKEPGYFIERSSDSSPRRRSNTSSSFKSENGTITITDLEAR